MRKTAIALAFAGLSSFTGHATASGIPTVDVAAIAQQLMDYANQVAQLEQMLQQVEQGVIQIDEARRTFDNLNGIRDLGSLLNSELYNSARDYLPAGWEDTLRLGNDISNGRYSSLRGVSEALRTADRLYVDRTSLNLPAESEALRQLDKQEELVNLARTGTVVPAEVATARVEELKGYKNQINTRSDQKAILDLQASMLAESLMIQNELVQTINRRSSIEAQEMVQQQQGRERALRISHLPYDPSAANERARAMLSYE